MKILHFADAHIDMTNFGRHDPVSGLPYRVLDFLKSLDTIIDTAVNEKVDLVIFAGDAYKDRTPAPTFQREWGKRLMRLSSARIPTILVVGNHDVSPSIGRAHALQEFDTLQVPYLHVIEKPQLLTQKELGIPVQVIGLPWISPSGFMAAMKNENHNMPDVYANIEDNLIDLVKLYIGQTEPDLPTILTAHASVMGASYGWERKVSLGTGITLPGSMVKDDRLDYVALGHIHKPQNLNGPGPEIGDQTPYSHPPVIYPGSIERVDFGEAKDEKYFVIVDVKKGQSQVEWRRLTNIRDLIEVYVKLESGNEVTEQLKSALPAGKRIKDASLRLVINYPRDFEKLINETEIRQFVNSFDPFDFSLVKQPQSENRVRLSDGQNIASLTPLEMLDKYWLATHVDQKESDTLQKLAENIIQLVN
ncbi:MAG: exonuclease SbcCD subunit D [Chloroflexota bacterium]